MLFLTKPFKKLPTISFSFSNNPHENSIHDYIKILAVLILIKYDIIDIIDYKLSQFISYVE